MPTGSRLEGEKKKGEGEKKNKEKKKRELSCLKEEFWGKIHNSKLLLAGVINNSECHSAAQRTHVLR